MKRKRTKTIWCYLNGKKYCDIIDWALTENVTIDMAKKVLTEKYPRMEVMFKVEHIKINEKLEQKKFEKFSN